MLAKIENGVVTKWPLGEQYVRTEYPNISFAFPLTQEILSEIGFAKFQYSDKPTFNKLIQEAIETTPVLSDGIAIQSWEIIEKYSEEEKIKILSDYQSKELEQNKQSIREIRDIKLKESDWMVIRSVETGINIDEEWINYRQQLRDITTHVNFPNLQDSDWPTEP